MTKIFLTGATGLMGGDILYQLNESPSKLNITTLVRGQDNKEIVAKAYPGVNVHLGDLDDDDLIERLAADADVVIHAAQNKHIRSVKSISRGLISRTAASPAVYIQISGASVISVPDILGKTYGEASDHIYDDLDHAEEVKSIIFDTSSRAVDQAILTLGREHSDKVNTAIVFPPIVYGVGRGPVNQRSIQIPTLCKNALNNGTAIYVGSGEARWGNVHVKDISGLITSLVEAGTRPQSNPSLWNDNGMYFLATGEQTWKSIAERLSDAGSKLGKQFQVVSIAAAEADTIMPGGSIFFGTNARGVSARAQAFFKYKSTGTTLDDEIEQALRRELEA